MKAFITAIAFLLFPVLLFSQKDKAGSSQPFVLGLTEELPSAILGEKRTINIYLPDGFKQTDTTKYAVTYLLDGGADEDFIHVAGLYQFNNFPWIERVPKTIVVGIANTDRKRDFTFPTNVEEDKKRFPTTGQSANFIAFIEKELQPHIQNKYKTTGAKTIIGQSLGGLLATEILFKKPALFTEYIIISPSLWWDDASLLNYTPAFISDSLHAPAGVYIGVGKEGLVPTKKPHVMEVEANLLAEKIKLAVKDNTLFFFDYLPQEDHATIGHLAVFNALRLLHPHVKKGN